MADFPSVPFTTLELRNNTPTIVSTSLSGLENRTQVGTQYWSFTATFNNISDSQRRQIMGFLMSKRGNFSPFSIGLPEPFEDSSGNYATSPITISTGAAGATTVVGTGVSNSTLILKAGDFVSFANHNKVYMVTADATSTGSGQVSVNLWPALRTSVASSTMKHKNVEIYVRCSQDQISFSSDPNLLTTMDLDFVEVIQ